MKERLTLCLFVDALGWEILKQHPLFLEKELPYRKPLESILGYSSACDPSIISGRLPDSHGHFSSFYWAGKKCPYAWVKYFKFLPRWLTSRGRFRSYTSRLIAWMHGFDGYFQIYHFPFKWLGFFDYAEKWRIWKPGGMNQGENIFDDLHKDNIPYYVGDQDSEAEQIKKVSSLIENKSISFAYLLFGKLDAVMHEKGTKAAKDTLAGYEKIFATLIALAKTNYKDVEILLFSDHGMHDVTETVDVQSKIAETNLTFGKDYAAVYDSTMVRFWFFKREAKEKIQQVLTSIPQGRVLSDAELKHFGTFFPDHRFGEIIFLLKPGVLIVPSFMGEKKVFGMHGYDPSDRDSLALVMSNHPLPEHLVRIEGIYYLIKEKIEEKTFAAAHGR